MIQKLAIVTLAASAALQAQDSAKALFMDQTTGVSVQSSGQARPVMTTRTHSRPALSHEPSSSAPTITGIGYWVELKTDSGQLVRTNSSQVFHTGERIRLHVTSNVDGQLTILQSQDGGPYTKLFPRSEGASGRVDRMQTNTFPAQDHWFRFDNQPGEIHLMLMVQADNAMPSQAPSQTNSMNAGTSQHPASDQELEAKLRANVDKLRGSKALVLEDDTASVEKTSYAVVDTRRDTSVPSGLAAIEIKLNHR